MRKVHLLVVLMIGLLGTMGTASAQGNCRNFVVQLTGSEQVPAVDTQAHGVAILHVNDNGTISYKLIVANIVNVTAAHIHVGATGTNGPVVVPLYSGQTTSGRTEGVLAEGTITNPDLAQALCNGNYYVNVHTTAHPGGEIRGQIEPAGK